jgi:hypothetical protein
MLERLSLQETRLGNDVLLANNPTARVSALNDSVKLGRKANAILFHIGATGILTIKDAKGGSRAIDSTKWVQGVWHLVEATQVMASGTTIPNTAFELGWGI